MVTPPQSFTLRERQFARISQPCSKQLCFLQPAPTMRPNNREPKGKPFEGPPVPATPDSEEVVFVPSPKSGLLQLDAQLLSSAFRGCFGYPNSHGCALLKSSECGVGGWGAMKLNFSHGNMMLYSWVCVNILMGAGSKYTRWDWSFISGADPFAIFSRPKAPRNPQANPRAGAVGAFQK